jgi:Spy/CpxP family protein refolding chaperone
MSDMEDVSKQQREVMKQIGELSKEEEVDDKKLNSLVKQANDFEKKKIDMKYEFFKETGKILTPEQQARYVVFERKFKKELKKGIREHGKEKGKDRRRDRDQKRPRGRGRGGL